MAARPALLCILDGWGWRADPTDNAIAAARTPNYTRLLAECPHALLQTSGRAVGLPSRPDGQFRSRPHEYRRRPGGGAGSAAHRCRPSRTARWPTRPALQDLIAKAKAAKGAVHLMGLLSPGGVHSPPGSHGGAGEILVGGGLAGVRACFSGWPRYAAQKRARLSGKIPEATSRAAPACGWPRCRAAITPWTATSAGTGWRNAYAAMVDAAGRRFDDVFAALDASYAETSPMNSWCRRCWAIMPAWPMATRCCSPISAPTGRARFRLALLEKEFAGFERARVVKFSAAAGMTEYSEELKALMAALFPPQDVRETLGEVMAEHHLKQLRIAETEKYAHVTFFLNAGREEPFAGEDRILVPSPKVSTYDHKPEMSAYQVTDKLVEAIARANTI